MPGTDPAIRDPSLDVEFRVVRTVPGVRTSNEKNRPQSTLRTVPGVRISNEKNRPRSGGGAAVEGAHVHPVGRLGVRQAQCAAVERDLVFDVDAGQGGQLVVVEAAQVDAADAQRGRRQVEVLHDVPGLELILQTDTVSESGGAFAVQATLRRTAAA